ncbi:MAG: hypothetical protein WCT26_03820 [Candidatus Buchananbacteria bacterium]
MISIDINSVPWTIVFPHRKSPLEKFGGGGVSGRVAQPFTWALAQKLARLTAIPVIWPSMWDYSDLHVARCLGAQAVSFGSVFIRYPWRPTQFVRREINLKT